MKKLVIIFLCLSEFIISFGQKRHSVLYEDWINNGWQNSRYDLYAYDNSGNLTSILSQTWNGSSWMNNRLITYTNDTSGRASYVITQNWNNGAWVNNAKTIYTYNVAQQKITMVAQNWINTNWQNFVQESYTYDINNFLIFDTITQWNSVANAWNVGSLITYANRLDGLVDSSLQQYGDSTGTNWQNAQKDIYAYNSSSLVTTHVVQPWMNQGWQNDTRYSYTYDTNNNNISYLAQKWDRFSNSWTNNNSTVDSMYYDNNGRRILSILFAWYQVSNQFQKQERATYTYIDASGISEVYNPDFQLFPNPTSDYINVQPANNNDSYELQVVDPLGNVFLQSFGQKGNTQLDLNRLSSGLYIVLFKQNTHASVFRIIRK